MRISTVKIISLLFFILSAFYLYSAHQIRVFSFDEDAPFNAKTFPIYLGYLGMFLSILCIILPEKTSTEVNHKVLDYKSSLFFQYFIYIQPLIFKYFHLMKMHLLMLGHFQSI